MDVSVGELVKFVYFDQDLESGFRSLKKAVRGVVLHREYQESKSAKADYSAEVFLTYDFEFKGREFTLKGKADGIFRDSGIATVEEIKTGSVQGREESALEMHLAQAKCYAFMYSRINNEDSVKVLVTYLDETGPKSEKSLVFTKEELERDFFALFDKYYRWIEFEENRRIQRNATLKKASFPHSKYRKGQDELSASVFEAIESSKTLFFRAPTGIGKTVATIFPAMKAIGDNLVEKAFYLTAKNTTREVVEKTLELFLEKGVALKSVSITAKSRICFMNLEVCDTSHCPYAKGYYGRVNGAIIEALENDNLLTRNEIEKYAEKHSVCPFEFSLDVSNYCDFIVCDYNYLFDPAVFLRRYFTQDSNDFVFLVDEAHNLPDRAREMFSAQLKLSDFSNKKYLADDDILEGCTEAVEEFFRDLASKLPEEGFWVQKEPVEEIIELLAAFSTACGLWLEENYGKKHYEELLKLYFDVQSYLKTFEYYGPTYVTYTKFERGDVLLKQFCLDPSENIGQILKKGRSGVFFSATLKPIEYYRDILGGNHDSVLLELNSPFPKENLAICVTPFVSTKYASRDFSLICVCSIIHELISSKKGNYMAYFPSYVYLEKALACFEEKYPDVKIIGQKAQMTESQRKKFLKNFKKTKKEGVLGFAVMGGVFSEGIDLHGEKLSGAVIVGVGLPRICFELDIIREYFESKLEAGFEFAYMYPGMNKVLQAAGRVIRTEKDRGAIILVDERFSLSRYTDLFPEEWSNFKTASSTNDVKTILEAFWAKATK
ncbi:PD-(D/E)XK nuclease family protein [candidate division WOR-3 bacterium]|nr:PD-(D/E)XK nuclease family protein [candidate division WOR-3 bacterium]